MRPFPQSQFSSTKTMAGCEKLIFSRCFLMKIVHFDDLGVRDWRSRFRKSPRSPKFGFDQGAETVKFVKQNLRFLTIFCPKSEIWALEVAGVSNNQSFGTSEQGGTLIFLYVFSLFLCEIVGNIKRIYCF